MKKRLGPPGILFIFCFISFRSVYSQPCGIVPFILPADESFCTCDLLVDVCDVDCCCDTRCDSDLFSKCLPLYPRNLTHSCSKFVQIDPSSTKLKEIYNFSLFCIHKTNYLNPDFYIVPQTLCTKEAIDKLPPVGNPSNPYQFEQPSPQLSQVTTESGQKKSYQPGSIIQTVYKDPRGKAQAGILTFPYSDGFCVPQPLRYKSEQKSSCVSAFKSQLETSCRSGSLLDPRRFYENFQISLVPIGNASDLVTDLAKINPRRLTCLDDHGKGVVCPFSSSEIPSPTFNASEGMCRGSVKGVEYEFEFDEAAGIKNASVSFVFQDVTNSNVPFTQTFKVRYYQGAPDELQRRSSPGYVIGQPIMAGQMRSTNSSDESTVYFVNVSSDSRQWLTMATSGPDGRCSENLRKPILFGTNMASGCFADFTLENISSTCSNVSSQMVDLVLPGLSLPTHVARYANSETENLPTTQGWILIQNNTAALPQTYSNNIDGCANMISGLDIEISFRRTGFIGSLVTEISRVTYRYATRPALRFPCPENKCEGVSRNVVQRAEILTKVTFIDESSPPMYRKLKKPRLKISLPEDFFYPLG